jgi:hypothetical protein
MNPLLRDTLLGVLLPAAVAAVILLPLRLNPSLGERPTRLLGGLAVALGFFAAYAALGFAPLKPADAWHWLPWLGVGAALVGAVDRPGWLALVLRAAGAALAAWLLVPAWVDDVAPRFDALGLLGLATFLFATDDRSQPDDRGRAWPWLLVATAAASAAVLMIGGTASFAQLAGALAAALGGTAVVMLGRRLPPGVRGVGVVLLIGLMATGFFNKFSSVPFICYFLPVMAVPLADANVSLPRRQMLAVLVTLAAAVGVAVWKEPIDWETVFPSKAAGPPAPAEPG